MIQYIECQVLLIFQRPTFLQWYTYSAIETEIQEQVISRHKPNNYEAHIQTLV
jgi:hypothetical protein